MTEIRKQSLGVLDKVDEVLASLAEQAKEVLGYDVLAKHSVAVAELTPLQVALKDAEIEILNPKDVAQYQKERLIERTQELVADWIKDVSSLSEIRSYNRFGGPSWTEFKIAEYKQPVPEFVLAKAVQIKTAFPECEIFIEHLEDHPDPFLTVQIPDGRAYYQPREKYYVEVWAEPKFEGRV